MLDENQVVLITALSSMELTFLYFPFDLAVEANLGFNFFVTAKELKICGGVTSGGEVCCSADMELQLQAKAREKHDKIIKDNLHRLQQLMNTRGTRFDSKCYIETSLYLPISTETKKSHVGRRGAK